MLRAVFHSLDEYTSKSVESGMWNVIKKYTKTVQFYFRYDTELYIAIWISWTFFLQKRKRYKTALQKDTSLLCVSATSKLSKMQDLSTWWCYPSLCCLVRSVLEPKAPKPLDRQSRGDFLASVLVRYAAIWLLSLEIYLKDLMYGELFTTMEDLSNRASQTNQPIDGYPLKKVYKGMWIRSCFVVKEEERHFEHPLRWKNLLFSKVERVIKPLSPIGTITITALSCPQVFVSIVHLSQRRYYLEY